MLSSLTLTHFRNLPSLKLAFPPEASLIALTGPNGSGKTSVLEAISLLTPTRGLLGDDAKHQITHKAKSWTIFAEISPAQSPHLSPCTFDFVPCTSIGQQFTKSRMLQVDGQPAPLETLATLVSVVWLTPLHDTLFTGAPETRRRWLDDAATALLPAHAQAVSRYSQHRRARLKLLTQGRRDDWLEAEEKLAAEWGIAVLQNRLAYLSRLAPFLPQLQLGLHGAALEVLEAENPILALKGKFERSREIDARLERTHAGPNTLELTGTLALETGTTTLAQASSGQHKRALLLWLGAHAQLLTQAKKQPPIVLMDEFSAHLDAARRTELLQSLATLGCQIFLSDVERPHLPAEIALHEIQLPQ